MGDSARIRAIRVSFSYQFQCFQGCVNMHFNCAKFPIKVFCGILYLFGLMLMYASVYQMLAVHTVSQQKNKMLESCLATCNE